MKSRRIVSWFLFALIALTAAMVATTEKSSAIVQQQRSQIAIPIIINVTPSPLAFAPANASANAIVASFVRSAGAPAHYVDPVAALFAGARVVVAQTNQQAVRVEAEVTPNPNATLLTANNFSGPIPGEVVFTGFSGAKLTQSCAYQVKVQTTTVGWNLEQGLSNDFSSGFPGGDLANNTYLIAATPQPVATPFIVFPDNNNAFTEMAKNGGTQTYCVDLTITIPQGLAGGSYGTNAIYTLFF